MASKNTITKTEQQNSDLEERTSTLLLEESEPEDHLNIDNNVLQEAASTDNKEPRRKIKRKKKKQEVGENDGAPVEQEEKLEGANERKSIDFESGEEEIFEPRKEQLQPGSSQVFEEDFGNISSIRRVKTESENSAAVEFANYDHDVMEGHNPEGNVLEEVNKQLGEDVSTIQVAQEANIERAADIVGTLNRANRANVQAVQEGLEHNQLATQTLNTGIRGLARARNLRVQLNVDLQVVGNLREDVGDRQLNMFARVVNSVVSVAPTTPVGWLGFLCGGTIVYSGLQIFIQIVSSSEANIFVGGNNLTNEIGTTARRNPTLTAAVVAYVAGRRP